MRHSFSGQLLKERLYQFIYDEKNFINIYHIFIKTPVKTIYIDKGFA